MKPNIAIPPMAEMGSAQLLIGAASEKGQAQTKYPAKYPAS